MFNKYVIKEWQAINIIWQRELLLFWRNKLKVLTSIFLPFILVLIFGQGISSMLPSDIIGFDFAHFFYSGVLVLSVVVAVFDSTISLVWDREFGFMREILVAPISKTEIAIGKMLGAISRGLIQGILILMVAPFLHISLSVSTIGLCLLFIILISTGMAGLGIMVSSQISRMETFSLIMQFIVAPLVFLSGAFFPIEKIPQWMQIISHYNPLFYALNGLRYILGGKFIPPEYTHLIFYNFGFSLFIVFAFALVCFVGAILVFNKISILSMLVKIIEENEENNTQNTHS